LGVDENKLGGVLLTLSYLLVIPFTSVKTNLVGQRCVSEDTIPEVWHKKRVSNLDTLGLCCHPCLKVGSGR